MGKDVLTKAKVVSYLNENIGLSKRECQFFFESFIELIYNQLKSHNDVKIINFGIFKVKNKKPRIGEIQRQKKKLWLQREMLWNSNLQIFN